ncbi:hypothetical protein GCM10009613_32980 [Pseudonocardia kongjuensis]|uniref:Dimethylamine monooxygenase subunit DmmA-like C-terminal domain-containing protein n=1 Tax=Pseudonocardia kongjuensis TaxID=102227 RepID=A0ABP4IL96_9PSEU
MTSPEHTSVPRRPAVPPGVDRAARRVLVLAVGDGAATVARTWRAEAGAAGIPAEQLSAASAGPLLGELDTRLATARVGIRLMVAGPECDVLRIGAVALARGLLTAETTTFATDDRVRRVWCPHCDTTTTAEVPVGGRTGCAGCGRTLLVHHHVSRREGCYLGFSADAEEAS